MELGDSDNYMRLAEVRDWLGGQSWWDIRQHRVDPGSGGLYTHWSRLADLPLAVTLLILRPLAAHGPRSLPSSFSRCSCSPWRSPYRRE